MIDLDAAIASRLRRKHAVLRSRAESSRARSEFVPKSDSRDRSTSPANSSRSPVSGQRKAKPERSRKDTSLDSKSSRSNSPAKTSKRVDKEPEPSKISEMITRAAGPKSFNNRDKPPMQKPPPYSDKRLNKNSSQPTGVKQIAELNRSPPPEPFVRPTMPGANRRGSDASMSSRLSRRLKFWDHRRHADETAASVLARVKPVGA